MSGEKITDWIQAGAVVTGLLFAIYQVEVVKSDRRISFTTDLVLKRSESTLTDSAVYLLNATKHEIGIDPDNSEFQAGISPFRQYIKAWIICYKRNLCDREIALETACGNLFHFEESVKAVYLRFSKRFDPRQRSNQKSDLWRDCEERSR